jgi:hypothetical protein
MYNSENVEPENVNTENVNTENVNTENVNTENVEPENVEPENVNTENVEPENVDTENVNTENVNTEAGLGDILDRLGELLKDNKMKELATMDMSNIENDMNNMVEELKKKNDPNIMCMLNLLNNLTISNLTDSNFSLGDCEVSNLDNQKTFSDTSDEDEEVDEDYENRQYNDNSSTDTDEDLLNYMKDREENEDMVFSIKQKLEEID